MADILQGIINGVFASIGFFIVEIYLKPFIEQRRLTTYLKDKFVELKDLKK